MDYVAIDFETANFMLSSACSIGIIGVVNDKIKFEKYYLINPEDFFLENNIMIHHIKPEDVKHSPTFKELYPAIKEILDYQIVVAHNAPFDIAVLRACISKYHLEPLDIRTVCTLQVSRYIWKDEVPNHRLGTMSGYLDVEHDYHQALSDSRICVHILNRAMKATSTCTVKELYDSLNLVMGRYNKDIYINPHKRKKGENDDNI